MAQKQYSDKISSILLKREVIEAETLEAAEEEALASGVRIEKYLVDKHLVGSEDMTLALSEHLNISPISLTHFRPDPHLLELIPRETSAKRLVIPISRLGKSLTIALADPFDLMTIDELESNTGMKITALAAPEHEVSEAIAKLVAESSQGLDMEELMRDSEGEIEFMDDEDDDPSLDEMLEDAEGAPVIRIVNMILIEALRTSASDVHIEPMERSVRLRYRIDGILYERPGPPKNLQAAVISRIKIMSDLDIAERRLPQDGRFNIKALGKEVDLRVSVLPTTHGEKIVMRILDKSGLATNLGDLGLDTGSEEAMRHAIEQPHGIILVTGPTGSGKTTTLYSCLQELNTAAVNIITCEDPVEYQLPGVNQVQINSDVGLTFASSLRSILRQDPDIVLVGEIRDGETAEIAVKAALTGHLVLSTLHTNDASGAVTRLIDMGIEPFMLGSCLILAQAQRLYRKLCPVCRKPTPLDPDVMRRNGIPAEFFEDSTVYKAVGCPRCNSGYRGRGAIMEVLQIDEDIRDCIVRGADTHEIAKTAVAKGMLTLKMAGLARVRDGITSMDAALAVTGSE